MTQLEVACFNEESALLAAKEGADRIELCEDYSVGGLTPSAKVLQRLKTEYKVPVYAMIRLRGGDFCYSEREYEGLKYDLLKMKATGADGLVFGILTEDNKVDIERNKYLVQLAGGLPCTFHRAFDRVEDKTQALEDVIACGFKTILTSGGEHPAVEGVATLKALKEQAGDRITILVGGGVRSTNVGQFVPGFDFVHSACTHPGTEELNVEELHAIKALLK